MGGYNIQVKRKQTVNKKGGYGRITMGNESQSKDGKANKNVKAELKFFQFDSESSRERKRKRQAEKEAKRDRDRQKGGNSSDQYLLDKLALVFNLGMVYYTISYEIYLRIKKTSTPGYQ